ncbi:hypothetical protein VOLCADRAFT_100028 [Volvox carteri f. nagariensis]|uniref:Uncharacterized protein n=1 Tax=Volvox carteri f. nagariensis TaxID=3068 RepID=D8UJ85_VOLCA|nr:uncharacterized protein VOLCADRAFT_100028 [Volvox carteri f. nagariensis]EFJ40241.1 hypothetical protein VOLCADRAFT_100028 [Volvox carteri f. nagariensis]|eukprot:XP_002958721.1 hypothetical protein VOLCADRAFT_100028 [Volvox carteri f. nagariensis]
MKPQYMGDVQEAPQQLAGQHKAVEPGQGDSNGDGGSGTGGGGHSDIMHCGGDSGSGSGSGSRVGGKVLGKRRTAGGAHSDHEGQGRGSSGGDGQEKKQRHRVADEDCQQQQDQEQAQEHQLEGQELQHRHLHRQQQQQERKAMEEAECSGRGPQLWGGIINGRPVGPSQFYLNDEMLGTSLRPRLLTSVLAVGGGPIAVQELDYAAKRNVPWTYIRCRGRNVTPGNEYGPVDDWVRQQRQQKSHETGGEEDEEQPPPPQQRQQPSETKRA